MVTATLTVEDVDSYEIYNSGAKNCNANYNITDMVIPLTWINTIKVTMSGAPEGDLRTVTAVITYEGWESGY